MKSTNLSQLTILLSTKVSYISEISGNDVEGDVINSQSMVDGALTKKFEVEGGLMQGDPLSPIVFYLVLKKVIRTIKSNRGDVVNIYNRLTQHGVRICCGQHNANINSPIMSARV